MKPVDALITGFVPSPLLLKQSLAPIRTLRREGLIRHIHYVTWDSAESLIPCWSHWPRWKACN